MNLQDKPPKKHQYSPVPASIFQGCQFKSPPFKGLVNHGNCCYMNAVIQIIVNLRLFTQDYEPRSDISKYFKNLQARYSQTEGSVDIKDFRDLINQQKGKIYHKDDIYDTMELLSIIIQLFDEQIRDKFISIDANMIEYKNFAVPLQMLSGKLSVESVVATFDMIKYPEILVIEVPRGKDDGYKAHELVYYKQSFLLLNTKYELVAVLHHKGFEKDGHYIAKIRSESGLFYLVDQQTVIERQLQTASRNVIALFYRLVQ